MWSSLTRLVKNVGIIKKSTSKASWWIVPMWISMQWEECLFLGTLQYPWLVENKHVLCIG
jgi:hypothetical protein